jgi:hypothetical protein
MATTLLAWGFIFLCFGVGLMALVEATALLVNPPTYCVPSNPRM